MFLQGKNYYELVTDWFNIMNTYFCVNGNYKNNDNDAERFYNDTIVLTHTSVVFHLGDFCESERALDRIAGVPPIGTHIIVRSPKDKIPAEAYLEHGFRKVLNERVILNGRLLITYDRDSTFDYGLYNVFSHGIQGWFDNKGYNLNKRKQRRVLLNDVVTEIQKKGRMRTLSMNAAIQEAKNIVERYENKQLMEPEAFSLMAPDKFRDGITLGIESIVDNSAKNKGLWFIATGLGI